MIAQLIVALGAVSLNPPANPQYIETAWIVQPDPSQASTRDVRDGEYVLKQRLLAPSIIELKADAVDAKSGRVLAKTGDQLFAVLTAGPPVYCITGVPKADIMRSLLVGGGNVQRCMVDENSDGSLDGHFGAGNAVPGLPNFLTKRAKKPKPTTGGAFIKVDPASDRQQYFVGIRYEGRAGIIGKGTFPTFSIRFGTENNTGRLTADEVPSSKLIPSSISILGSRFTVLSRNDEVIRVAIEDPMPEQRFGVVMQRRY